MDKRWAILALLFVTRTGLGFQFQTLGSVSSVLVDELGLSYAEIGSLIGLFMVPGMFLAIPAGLAGRFVSDRFIVGLGLLTLGAGGGLASVAEGFELLAAARLISGVGFVFSNIYFAKIVTDLFSGKELATAMGAFVMSWPCGIAMGQIGHVWLASNFDWRMAFVVASVYCVTSALLLMIFYRDVPGPVKQASSFRFTLNRNEFCLIVFVSLIWSLFNAGYVVYLGFAPRVLEARGFDPVSAQAVISIASWLMIFSGFVCGMIADRSGKADLVFHVCMAAAILALLMLFISPLAVASSVVFGMIGIAPAGVIMALTAQAMRPQNRAIGMGLFFTTYFLVQAPAPAIAGWLYDLTENEMWPMIFAATLFLCTSFANLAFRNAQRRMPI
ncbi:MAG: MFS transporter [Cohaesibacteraceae bacterium]|nr:MFS transporter [Cohaesibacteraceae bacterium]